MVLTSASGCTRHPFRASTLCSNGTMNTARLCCKKSLKLRNFCKDVTHFHSSLKYSGIRYTWVSGVLSSLVYAPTPIHKYGRAGTKKLTCHVGMGMPKLKALLCWAFLHPFWAERIEIKNYHNSLNSFFVFFGWFVSSQTFVLRRFCSKKITQMHTKSRSATKKDHGFMINCAEKSFQDLSFKWKRVGNPNLSTRWRRLLFHQRCGVHFGSEGLPKKGSWVGSC